MEELAASPSTEYPIVCNNLKKVYPARDGNPPKYAVNGFSLAVPKGECFGILGPNGAGKTSSINMVTTLSPSSSLHYHALQNNTVLLVGIVLHYKNETNIKLDNKVTLHVIDCR